MEAAGERPGTNTYTWRDRYLTLFQTFWDRQEHRAAVKTGQEGAPARHFGTVELVPA
jgi:hypothetical protein